MDKDDKLKLEARKETIKRLSHVVVCDTMDYDEYEIEYTTTR